MDSRQEILHVYSLDYDGCTSNGYSALDPDAIINENPSLIEDVKNSRPRLVKTISGSNRQCFDTDALNSKNHSTHSSFSAFVKFSNYLAQQMPGTMVEFDPFFAEDVLTGQAAGAHFASIVEWMLSDDLNIQPPHNNKYRVESKFPLLYGQINMFGFENQEKKIIFEFRDDRSDILNELAAYFRNGLLLPPNVSLILRRCRPHVENSFQTNELIAKIDGKGVFDPHWRRTMIILMDIHNSINQYNLTEAEVDREVNYIIKQREHYIQTPASQYDKRQFNWPHIIKGFAQNDKKNAVALAKNTVDTFLADQVQNRMGPNTLLKCMQVLTESFLSEIKEEYGFIKPQFNEIFTTLVTDIKRQLLENPDLVPGTIIEMNAAPMMQEVKLLPRLQQLSMSVVNRVENNFNVTPSERLVLIHRLMDVFHAAKSTQFLTKDALEDLAVYLDVFLGEPICQTGLGINSDTENMQDYCLDQIELMIADEDFLMPPAILLHLAEGSIALLERNAVRVAEVSREAYQHLLKSLRHTLLELQSDNLKNNVQFDSVTLEQHEEPQYVLDFGQSEWMKKFRNLAEVISETDAAVKGDFSASVYTDMMALATSLTTCEKVAIAGAATAATLTCAPAGAAAGYFGWAFFSGAKTLAAAEIGAIAGAAAGCVSGTLAARRGMFSRKHPQIDALAFAKTFPTNADAIAVPLDDPIAPHSSSRDIMLESLVRTPSAA